MPDPFAGRADISSQGETWAAVTPADGVAGNITPPKALWANVAGDINMAGSDGVFLVFTVPAGTPISLRPTSIKATGTTATGIRAIY